MHKQKSLGALESNICSQIVLLSQGEIYARFLNH